MNIKKLEELTHKIDFTKLLESTGNKIQETKEGQMWQCPFHATGEDLFLNVNTVKKMAECSWCEKSWSMFDYIKELKKFDDNQAFEYLEKYYNETKSVPDYNITNFNKHEIVIKIEDREYQLTGVKLKRLNDFSMTIKLTYNFKFSICDVNLSRIKSRYDFIQEAKDYLFIGEDLLKQDIVLLMEAIEKLQRENILRLDEDDQNINRKFDYTEDEENKAIEYLSKHDVLKEDLLKDTEKLGYVGDKLGKIILYLACTSRKLNKPISVLSVANSSAGKSFAQDNILSLMPDDELYSFTRLTPMSLSHFGKKDLCNSIVCVDEFSGVEEEAMYQVRSLLSKGKLSIAYTSIDHKSGRMITKTKEVNGPVAFITSTTHEELIDDETRSRYIILKIDTAIP
jgi:DNA primase